MERSIVIKAIPDADTRRAKALWKRCFTEDSDAFIDYYFAERVDRGRMLGLYEDGTLASMLCVRVRSAYFESDVIKPVGFIAGVCTLPEYRRRGHVRRLLDEANRLLAKDGVFASVLQPFDVQFYRKLGYVPLAQRLMMELTRVASHHTVGDKIAKNAAETICQDAVNFKYEPSACVRGLTSADATSTCKIYTRYMRGRTSALVRAASDFRVLIREYLLEPGSTVGNMGFAAGDRGFAVGNMGAYALGYQNGGRMECDEFAYTDEKSAQALVLGLLGHCGTLLLPLPVETMLFKGRREAEWVGGGFRSCKIKCTSRTDDFNMIKVLDTRFFDGMRTKNANELRNSLPTPFAFEKY